MANAAIALKNGETDYLMNPAPLDVVRLRARSDIVVTDKGREGYATVETMVPNLTRAPLNDLRVRQAIAHTIDKLLGRKDHLWTSYRCHLPGFAPAGLGI